MFFFRHTPEFEFILYHFQVQENNSDSLSLGQVVANDKDSGKFGEVTYSLVGDLIHTYFKVNQYSGDISLRHPLDREVKDFFMVPAMAQDRGGRTTFTSIYVVVEDVNDHSPEFTAASTSEDDLPKISISVTSTDYCTLLSQVILLLYPRWRVMAPKSSPSQPLILTKTRTLRLRTRSCPIVQLPSRRSRSIHRLELSLLHEISPSTVSNQHG